jgi:aspartyl-tRNA(Asn)/glutamyl-tRNA(Gln) amidotransferase subunit A
MAGLPVGLQIVAPYMQDDLVLRVARAFESIRPWPTIAKPRTGH